MSYSRTFKKTISVHYSGSISYPPSEHGGTKSYSGYVDETILFDVEVDTRPFDKSVDNMKNQVNLLTGSVVATEAAQVASIRESSRKVGKTIVDGFFNTVRFDITSQIASLKIKVDSLLLQLNELAKRCKDKERVMTVDYQMISARYTKIFEELNRELENRIYALDEPVFKMVEKSGEINSELTKHIGVPTVHASENARLHSKISAALTKREAANTIGKAKQFLEVQYRTDRLLDNCLIEGGQKADHLAPYIVMESSTPHRTTDTDVYCSEFLEGVDRNALAAKAEIKDGNGMMCNEKVADYFNAELAGCFANDASEKGKRVAAMVNKLYRNNCH